MTRTVSNDAGSFPLIPGYALQEQLYLGSRTVVYRALETTQQRAVVLKLLRHSYPSFSELVQFRNQYTITKNLTIPGIVHPFSLEPCQNGYALVMEDCSGISLRQYAQQHPLAVPEVLEIAMQLADILHDLHHNRVIHKDIKPANILIQPTSHRVKLIDFSIASLLPKENQEIQNPNVLEGTLAYLAPEQTGRMNRGIDYRTDFYSLGITLYELLTGQLPFLADDPLELVHCHIAKTPLSPHQINPSVPPVVSAIALKLMAKNAEDRYQSALGLKHDLEQCLSQYRDKNAIAEFKLGQRDICDRFLIPERLYGREQEVKTLLQAFERVAEGTSEIMLVAGFSGIGKTAVVNEVHKPITRQHGYFIKGKFDQFNRNIPLSAFVQALRDLINQLLSESDSQLAKWRTQILEGVGDSGQVLIEVMPELEQIIGKQPPVPELAGTAAQIRFNLLFQTFIEVFTTAEHPLVVFLDDLQWSDSASLQLIKLLMEDKRYLLLLGAYRDNEVSPTHPFSLTLEELKKAGKAVNTITLTPLAFEDTNQLIADTLHCSQVRSQPLTKFIDRKTKGNPFFTTQFLKALYEENHLLFNRDQGYWECDISQVNALAITDDVVEFMAQQLQKLPLETQHVLKLAACIGNQFDLETLAIVSEQSQANGATALWKALQEGLILPQSEVYKFYLSQGDADSTAQKPEIVTYRFLHDRIQQAAYSLIPENEKKATHHQIGTLLLSNSSAAEREERLFEIVTHLNAGSSLMTQASEQEDLARLNLLAGRKAQMATAYAAAVQYLTLGRSLLAADSWQTQYELALDLYSSAVEAEYLNINFQQATDLADIALQNAKTLLDRVKVYELQMQICISQLQMLQAIEIGLDVLEKLGITWVELTPEDSLIMALPALEDLDHLPSMTDEKMLAAMQILKILCAPVFMAKPEIFPQLIMTMVRLCLDHGNSALSAFAYGFYGLLLSGTGHLEEGYQAGKIALRWLEKFDAKELKAKVYNLFNSNIRTWKEHKRNSVAPLQEAVQSGLETGDIEWGGYCAANLCSYLFFSERTLEAAVEKQGYYVDLCIKIKQEIPINFSQVWRQLGLNLQGRGADPQRLMGESFDETEALPRLIEAKSGTVLYMFYVAKTILLYHAGNYRQATEQVVSAQAWSGAAFGFIQVAILNFYHSLALVAQLPQASDEEKQQILLAVEANQELLQNWAVHAPMNHQHKYDLIEAEKAWHLGHIWQAMELYDQAILGARTNSYLQEEALANELAAKFYLALGKERVAAGYLQEAYYGYAHWGAKTKSEDLERHYPNLLRPILQQAARTLNPLETLATLAAPPNFSLRTSNSGERSSSSSINAVLDFAAILRASQAISGTIQLDQLLHQLTQIILQNSGGDRCALVLPDEQGVWQVRAIATAEKSELCLEPLEGNVTLPAKLIQYVKNTQEVIAFENCETSLPVMDDYLYHQQPKSVLCLPMINQGNLLGIVYLRNQLTSGVFTNDRILILNFLCIQAAIALENARLYQQSQTYAQQLEQSQLQIVQSEKMASLGNLVAGVAHEINNPIGFLNGSLSNAKDYVRDLLGHLALYQKHHSEPSEELQDHAEEIDLEFLIEDLPRLLESMQEANDRIKSISTSLRTFSRADTEYKVNANLHEGINSALLILKYRLKGNEYRPAIEVIQEYGKLPAVKCFPGQLNQVFMNILANAIDVFDEVAQQSSFEELQRNPQRITIRTEVLNDQDLVKIQFCDNGKGMTEAVKTRIFDHLFTTKDVGKGTGLGLAIAHQIVTETHGGRLDVKSELGKGTEFLIQLPIFED